ncbi:hypothetical protein AB0F24_05825 [Streptomyces platensis]|uniref:hypothetical protein n=1 Tax=Streptomyces platensis TaxID=58346 RepID=UPI0033C79F3B
MIGARKAVYSVPDEQVTATVDVRPWIEQKIAAVLAHRSEVERGALPGLIAACRRMHGSGSSPPSGTSATPP